MSPARLIEGIERMGPVFTQIWGQTESAGMGTALWRSQHDVTDPVRLTSCGQAIPGVRLAILDGGDQEVAPGEAGEICLRGTMVMNGYHQQPELTEKALAHGWLHTGDVGRRDDQGFVYIVDRVKDLIISGGFNVYPGEIEKVLSTHPNVSSCAVIGVPDHKWGEAVKAVVVARPGTAIDVDALIALVRDQKGPVCTPKSVDVVDAIPVTAVGKADKKVLRAKYWQGLDRNVH
jgi:fatty-acyl-CoA synthase